MDRSRSKGRMRQTTNRSSRLLFVVVSSVALCVVLTLFWMGRASTTEDASISTVQSSSTHLPSSLSSSSPVLHRGPKVDSNDYLWQLPPQKKQLNNRPSRSSTRKSSDSVKGLLFLAHGCHHVGTDWWKSTPTICPECIGLPEERAIVEIALSLNLAVVALSSIGLCWRTIDGPRVAQVLQYLIQHEFHNNRGDLPIFAFGASSGGNFVSSILPLALKNVAQLKLAGYISQIMAPAPTSSYADEIPAVFITMNGDPSTEKRANNTVNDLHQKKVAALQIRVGPIPLQDDWFASRIDTIDEATSRAMVKALLDANLVDRTKRLLRDNPRTADWRTVLRPVVTQYGIKDNLVADQSPISEVLNVAYNQHEMTRDGVQDALDFLLLQAQQQQQLNK